MNTLDHPFRVGDRVRYARSKSYGTAQLVGRVHYVSRVLWKDNGVGGFSDAWIELLGMRNKISRDGSPEFPAGIFVLVSRHGSITA